MRKNPVMFRLSVSICALLFAGSVLSGTLHDIELEFEGRERHYAVYEPAQHSDAAPVIFVLHGGLGNADYTQRYGFNELAEQEGFFAVYPEGIAIRRGFVGRNRLVWNAGGCCGRAAEENVNDVAFIADVVRRVIAEQGADPHRIYVTGMSNGAMMTYRLVCELNGVFAAAIPVAGVLMQETCQGGMDIPLLHIHGDADDNVPIAGGKGKGIANVIFNSLDFSLQAVTQNRDCPVPDVVVNKEMEERSYLCNKGAPVVARILPGVEHTWPGLSLRRNEGGTYSATEAAWAFARQYSRKVSD